MDDRKHIMNIIMEGGDKHIEDRNNSIKPANNGQRQKDCYGSLDEPPGRYRPPFKEGIHCHQCHNPLRCNGQAH